MTKRSFLKGQYEEAVEEAKGLLNDGIGITQITQETGLDIETINKIQEKIEKKRND